MLKSKLNLVAVAALVLTGITSAFAQSPTPLITKTEAQWIAVLKSDAPLKDKMDACRELAVIGTPKSVPVLATLLTDEKLSHSARYALETLPDPSVDVALREALGQANGRPLVGIIGSIGVRHDAQATPALAKLLQNSDPDVAQAAARALGKIATTDAVQALQAALPAVSDANRLAFCEGLFRCAESLSKHGQRDAALAIYDRLRGLQKAPHQVRAGALRGAILTRGKDGLPLLIDALRGDDWILVAAAARTAMEMPDPEVTTALAAELPKGNADKQILITQVLGQRHDAAALPALFAVAKSGDKNVRLAAIRALPEIGHASAAPVLIGLLGDADGQLAQAAQESLAALPGAEVDAAVLALLRNDSADRRVDAIELIARRRMTTAVPALVKAATDPEAKVRPAALRRLGELAGPADLPTMLELLTNAKTSADLDAAEAALTAVCTKADDANGCSDKLTALLPQLTSAQKGTTLRVLSAIGGPSALKSVCAAVDDSNAEVHGAAIRALGAWKTADAAPHLLALAQKPENSTDRMLCLRSYMGLARNAELPANQRLTICRQAATLLQTADEKKMLLGTLGGISTPAAINVILPYLKDSEVKDEASAAALAIADRLLKGRNAARVAPRLVEPLQTVAQSTTNPGLSQRAQTLLNQARSKAQGK